MDVCLSTNTRRHSHRLPRRTILCLYLLCLIFVAGAFYTFIAENRQKTGLSYEPNREESIPDLVQPRVSNVTVQPDIIFSGGSATASPKSSLIASNNPISDHVTVSNYNTRTRFEVSIVGIKGAHNTKYIIQSSSGSSNSTAVQRHSSKLSTPLPTVTTLNSCDLSTKPPKLILLWTPFFGSWKYMPKGPFKRCSCPNCEVTTNRSRLLQSDAVIFHARDMSLADMPPKRLFHQRWVFYCLEAPPYSDFPGLAFMYGMFNWTMTYRSDSDIVTTYGAAHRVKPSRKLDLSSLESTWSVKTKSVIWMSSHCPTDSARDDYVAELRKYIDVDVYGTCGTYNCSQGATDRCMQNFAYKYKFFLAFENSICKDYITEKFFRTLKHDIIPVVFGGAKYAKFAPSGSFVDALSFKSPKHLAFFLAGLGSNFGLYSSYFLWRKDYEVVMDSRRDCDLCALLHRQDSKPSAYQDLRNWWVKEAQCRTWTPRKVVN